jgi:RimJ/RimL family protein N-acetyltransferase
VHLRLWSDADLDVLRAINSPSMKQYLGGPETEEQLLRRHRRYVEDVVGGLMMMYAIRRDGEGIGSVGYWQVERDGEPVYEAGWNVLPPYQGKGFATEAVRLMLAEAVRHGGRRAVHAYPSVDNVASNATCRSTGFRLLGQRDHEFPRDRWFRANDWRYDLDAELP